VGWWISLPRRPSLGAGLTAGANFVSEAGTKILPGSFERRQEPIDLNILQACSGQLYQIPMIMTDAPTGVVRWT
jgi:hypothetical protein